MDQFIATISTFPTAIWTVILGVVLVYWLASLLGMVDDWHVGQYTELDMPGHGDGGDWAAKLMALGLGGVPFSLVLSIYALSGWLFSALVQQYFLWLPNLLHYLLGAGLFLVCSALAIPCTALVLRPLRGLFVTHTATSKLALVGRACKISTMSVDEYFGRAEVAANGAPLNIRVCAASPNTLVKGSAAVILDYDPALDVYAVAALEDG
ncbi:ubiquinone biosynthesis protein [Chitinibacter sp. GC72]|uniref:ubiquinone biosynthesis protein n=1 Tax=Chitinibacter sp. GC72 TaxID=1526917 RepID=UPI0012FB2A66|nr:ubiquinone biosynthesis protein [Chitinibacter sp. GC72]